MAIETDDLIGRLAGDLSPVARAWVARRLALGLAVGAVLSAAAMLLLLGPRPDLHAAMAGGPFWMKFVYSLSLTLLGLVIVARQGRAGADSRQPAMALGGPVVALIVVAAIQLSAPDADIARLVMGNSWTVCPWLILLLALPLGAAMMIALRGLAPTRLSVAGAAAGLVAGAASATIYGFHCTESAAPFLLIWYTLGIAVAAGLGALVGRWALRW